MRTRPDRSFWSRSESPAQCSPAQCLQRVDGSYFRRPAPNTFGVSDLVLDPTGQYALTVDSVRSTVVEVNLQTGAERLIKAAPTEIRLRKPLYPQLPYLVAGGSVTTLESWDLRGLEVDWNNNRLYGLANTASWWTLFGLSNSIAVRHATHLSRLSCGHDFHSMTTGRVLGAALPGLPRSVANWPRRERSVETAAG